MITIGKESLTMNAFLILGASTLLVLATIISVEGATLTPTTTEDSSPATPTAGGLLSGLCDNCQNYGTMRTLYCCKTQQQCCPPAHLPGVECPASTACAKTGIFHTRTMCLYDAHCPITEKCCPSGLFGNCCKNVAPETPVESAPPAAPPAASTATGTPVITPNPA